MQLYYLTFFIIHCVKKRFYSKFVSFYQLDFNSYAPNLVENKEFSERSHCAENPNKMAPLPQGTGILRQKNISKSSIFRSETNILGGRQWAIYFFKKLHNQQEFWFARLGLITSENPAYFGDEKEAKISDGDSVIANATIEVILLQNQKHSVVVGPFPFNQKMTHCTVPLIETTKLLQNKFVIENDTCELHYQINVDKPQNNAEYLEILKMEEIEVEPINKHDYMSSYTVRKNKELCKSMKLRLKGCVTKDGVSSVFVLNGIPFQLMTCKIKHDKDGVDHLGIQLINSLEDDFSRGSCKVNIRCVISSSDWNISPISMEVIDETFKSKFHHLSLPLMTWEVLTKPSNFFVKNDSFLLEVDMTVERIGELKFYMPVSEAIRHFNVHSNTLNYNFFFTAGGE